MTNSNRSRVAPIRDGQPIGGALFQRETPLQLKPAETSDTGAKDPIVPLNAKPAFGVMSAALSRVTLSDPCVMGAEAVKSPPLRNFLEPPKAKPPVQKTVSKPQTEVENVKPQTQMVEKPKPQTPKHQSENNDKGDHMQETVREKTAPLKRDEVLDKVAEITGEKRHIVRQIVDHLYDLIGEALDEGREVDMANLGKFEVKKVEPNANGKVYRIRMVRRFSDMKQR